MGDESVLVVVKDEVSEVGCLVMWCACNWAVMGVEEMFLQVHF